MTEDLLKTLTRRRTNGRTAWATPYHPTAPKPSVHPQPERPAR